MLYQNPPVQHPPTSSDQAETIPNPRLTDVTRLTGTIRLTGAMLGECERTPIKTLSAIDPKLPPFQGPPIYPHNMVAPKRGHLPPRIFLIETKVRYHHYIYYKKIPFRGLI